MKIMVLDDNPEILLMVTAMLHSAYGSDNCMIISGRNGTEGLTLLLEGDETPDIILTNLRMPHMDGMTFVAEVRHNNAWDKIRVVMMSAVTSSEIMSQAITSGAEAYLRKPFTYRDLTTMINDMLAN